MNRVIFALLFFSLCEPQFAQAFEIRAIVLRFAGPEQVGRAVATILDLQIWRTLRETSKLDPSRGTIIWYDPLLEEETHASAERVAKILEFSAQLSLWGHVHLVGEDALVTAYATLPDYFDFRSRKHEIWSVTLNVNNQQRTLTVDLPQRHYSFRPIKLPAEFVAKYTTPDALSVLSRPGKGRKVGVLGLDFRLVEAGGGDYAKVCIGGLDQNSRCKGSEGWVHLPQLGAHRSEIVDFLGGLIRIYRGDWNAAVALLRRVASNDRVPTAIAVDAQLLIVRALAELGRPADREIAAIRTLAPPSRRAVEYIVMHLVQRCLTLAAPTKTGCAQSDVRAAADLIGRTRALFPADDPWLQTVDALLQSRIR